MDISLLQNANVNQNCKPMCPNVNCHDELLVHMHRTQQNSTDCTDGKQHWSPNPEGICDFLGNFKPPYDRIRHGGLRFTVFVIY